MKLTREEFLQQMVLAMAARQENFRAKYSVDEAIVAFEFIKANVLKNSAEFTSVSGRAALRERE
ncbi:hypothetical protein F9K96_06865 [Brucella anthropi]|uniref:hypothetical protein n=1 Tax=Brucella anthropi TaxID=529 RepID=UPI00124C1097|nr:hypothetical protein [Brucella anthropi]KAB2792842.1 hypothetical protein F9K96_06865 [Brucella anthropi]